MKFSFLEMTEIETLQTLKTIGEVSNLIYRHETEGEFGEIMCDLHTTDGSFHIYCGYSNGVCDQCGYHPLLAR